MRHERFASFAAAAVMSMMSWTTSAGAAEQARITGPFIHDNLAVYLVHGTSAQGPVPLTLAEALSGKRVIVHETGSVNELSIENTSDGEVFVQAGDIVKGGQQDRVLTVSLLLPPHSGKVPIAAYCVEHGRWTARAGESVDKFDSAANAMPSRQAKLAMLAPRKADAPASPPTTSGQSVTGQSASAGVRPFPLTQERTFDSTSARQAQVWSSVADAQRKLSENLPAPVQAEKSKSSLQLSLENANLEAARKSYVDALTKAATSSDDVVGYVFAINGKPDSGDSYASAALFQKMWPKLLTAAATAAIAEHNAKSATPPATDAIAAILDGAAQRPVVEETSLHGVIRATHETDGVYLVDTRRTSGEVVHRAIVAR